MKTKVFEIEVLKKGELSYPESKPKDWSYGIKNDNFEVSLPHSCDNWVISAGQRKDKVISDLKIFIEEAQQALKELEA